MNVYLLVDTSRSMAEGSPPKIDYAKKVAAALGYIGLKNLDRVGGASFSSRCKLRLPWGGDESRYSVCLTFSASCPATARPTCDRPLTRSPSLPPSRLGRHRQRFVRSRRLARRSRGTRDEKISAPGDSYLGRSRDQSQALGRCGVERCGKQTGTQIVFGRGSGSPLISRNCADYFKEIETVCSGRRIDYLRTTTQIPFEEFVLKTLRQVSSVT